MGEERRQQVLDYFAQRGGYDGLLGVVVVEATDQAVEAELTVDERHLQLHGQVHGGVYCSLVETLCSVGASLAAKNGQVAVGVENHTSFLRAVGAGTRLRIRAIPLSGGRRSQLWEARVTDGDERLIARGQVRLIALAPDGDRGRDSAAT